MSPSLSPITLTTDFGTTDHYVAQMKGVILGIASSASIVDVTHAIPPQDVRRAAILVADLEDAFSPGTVHVAVVDPGVGSDRAILAVAAGDQFHVAPDNGLLTAVFDRHPEASIVEITNSTFRRTRVSSTFHGRDVMAPAAAHLIRGVSLTDLGPLVSKAPVRLGEIMPTISSGEIIGTVAWIDRFGNLITNIPAESLAAFSEDRVRVRVGSHEFFKLRRFYAEVDRGEPIVLVGSSGRLEIALNGGDAATWYRIDAGETVIVDVSE